MKRIKLIVLLLTLCSMSTLAQTFTPKEKKEGYAVREQMAYFIFSPSIYGTTPERVVVTGSFRSWSSDLTDKAWDLKKQDDIWVLGVDNSGFNKVPLRANFKFRVNNDGIWMDGPSTAENIKGTDLVFMHNIVPPTLKAEILANGNVWASVEGFERPLNPSAYKLTAHDGKEIPVVSVLPNNSKEVLIGTEFKLDPKNVYYLEIPAKQLKSWCSYDGWFRHLYSPKELGANVVEGGKATVFRIFSPRATKVMLYLYKTANTTRPYQEIKMDRDEDGVWEAYANGNLKGVYYDFTVHGLKQPGNHFYETNPVHISDPYARVSMDSWGKSRVWEKTKPATPLKNGRPKMEDVIAYEVHVQDFTDLLPVSADLKGTIPAMVQPGLKNSKGHSIGFDYLTNLGINTVHLMPVQEYLHYPDDKWKPIFQNDPYMIENGINMENYQWGYRTSHAFAVETRYRKRGTEPGAERDQFRDLVQAFHDKGIAVIIDIVPNHTAENMDEDPYYLHFSVLDKTYYYRTKDLELIGEYGNEVKTENRPMVQRWLIDQCKHWIEEFGIDGFRIDLAGQVDEQTLTVLKKTLGDDIIIYGEPWIGSYDPEYEDNPDWDWYKADSPITFFQDDTRNAFKGPVSNPKDKKKDRGYAGGNLAMRDNVKNGLSANFAEDKTPLSGINYLDIHDNWALADQFATTNWDGRMGVDEERFKIAALLLYTSLGPIVTHGGTEMMRSKGAAELKEVVKKMKGGTKVYLHGKRDTYNMRKANQFIWENVGKKKGESGNHDAMYKFWRGLNNFRLSEKGKVFRQTTSTENYYQWIEPENKGLLGYLVDNKVLVVMNVGDAAAPISFELPAGNWKLVGNNLGFDHNGISKDGPKGKSAEWLNPKAGKHTLSLAPATFKVWVKQ